MKKLFLLFILLGQFIFTSAQNYTIDLQVAQFSEMSLAPFILANDLTGAPRIFGVTITPEQGNVKIRGEVYWKKSLDSGFEWLLTFRSKLFQARSFFNTDLGNGIELGKGSSDGDLVEENRKRNKPTGEYRLTIFLLDENGNELGSDTEYYEFQNPAQLNILAPLQGSVENIGGVLAEWTEIDGVSNYEVVANVVDENSPSLEEALTNDPKLIDNVNVGLVTSIDLRNILSREWLPGQEIVLQVSAVPIGGTPDDKIKSEIINFYLDDPSNPIESQTNEGFQALLQSFSDGLGSDLLDKLLNGDLVITDINWEDTGITLSPEEIQDLLNYLRQNPDNLISIEQD